MLVPAQRADTRSRQAQGGKRPVPTRDVSRLTFHVSRSSLQVEGDVGQDDSFFEQQRCLEEQRALVVQDALPPMGGENLRNDDSHPDVWFFLQGFFYVVEQGSQDRAVGRGEDEQIDTTTPLGPLNLDACRRFRIHIHHYCPNLAGTTARIVDCPNDRFIDAVDGNQDDIASWKWGAVITRQRHLLGDGFVVRPDRTEHKDQ